MGRSGLGGTAGKREEKPASGHREGTGLPTSRERETPARPRGSWGRIRTREEGEREVPGLRWKQLVPCNWPMAPTS